MELQFRQYLNEGVDYLGQKIGDITNALQDLQSNSASMGKRQVAQATEMIVSQIRGILHSAWSRKERHHMLSLQKIGVALAKAIEEKDDLDSVIGASLDELQNLSGKIGTPLNNLGSPDATPEQEPSAMTPEAGSQK